MRQITKAAGWKDAGGKGRVTVRIKEWLQDERGVGVVEIILILVILIALVLIFKTQMTSLVNTIFSTITSNAKTVMK